MLKQDVVFQVDVEQEAAIVELKRHLTEAPVLRIYSPEAEETELLHRCESVGIWGGATAEE